MPISLPWPRDGHLVHRALISHSDGGTALSPNRHRDQRSANACRVLRSAGAGSWTCAASCTRIVVPLEKLPERATAPGYPAEHQPDRILSRRRRGRVVLRHHQDGDRRRVLARPSQRPPRHRELDQNVQRAALALRPRLPDPDRDASYLAGAHGNVSISPECAEDRADSTRTGSPGPTTRPATGRPRPTTTLAAPPPTTRPPPTTTRLPDPPPTSRTLWPTPPPPDPTRLRTPPPTATTRRATPPASPAGRSATRP